MAKKAGLSKEDCKDHKKRKEAVKEYAKKGEKSTAKVSAIIEGPYDDDNCPVEVDTAMNESIKPFVFYIARKLEWMIDSGATEHITPYASDLSDYTTVITGIFTRTTDENWTQKLRNSFSWDTTTRRKGIVSGMVRPTTSSSRLT